MVASVTFRRFLDRHPVVSAVLAVVAIRGIPMAVGAFVGAAAAGLAAMFLVVAAVLIVRRQGWASMVGFNGPAKWKDVWLVWLPLLYAGAPLLNLIWKDVTGAVTARLITAALIPSALKAFVEETTFRGLVLAILLNRFHRTPAQIRSSVVGSAVLFGLWHLPTAPNWETNVAFWVYEAFAGVGFAGLSLRTRSIWLPMAVHTLLVALLLIVGGVTAATSAPASLSEVRLNAVVSVLIMLPWLLYGLYLIRNLEYGALTTINAEHP
jgi:membrane protease YdiL (CAAX protease family)